MDSIIFDVDGTIWDSTQSVADSWNIAIKEHSDLDLTLEPVSLSRVFGKTMTEIADAVFPDLEPVKRMELLDFCFEEENRYLETHPGTVYKGVVETIRELAEHYPLFIVSNCQCGYIEVMLKTTGLAPYIKDHLCFGETQTPKGDTIPTTPILPSGRVTWCAPTGSTRCTGCRKADSDICRTERTLSVKTGLTFLCTVRQKQKAGRSPGHHRSFGPYVSYVSIIHQNLYYLVNALLFRKTAIPSAAANIMTTAILPGSSLTPVVGTVLPPSDPSSASAITNGEKLSTSIDTCPFSTVPVNVSYFPSSL